MSALPSQQAASNRNPAEPATPASLDGEKPTEAVRGSNGVTAFEVESRMPPNITSDSGQDTADVVIPLPLSPFASLDNSTKLRHSGDGDSDSKDDEDDIMTHAAPQRMVSWQDEVNGQDLFTVREFEPSEAGHELEEHVWENEKKSCCSIM